MKIFTNELGHMTKIASMPIYGKKNLKNLLLQNQWFDGLGTWYVASGTRILPRLFKLCPWVDLDLFYDRVKYGKMQKHRISWKVL